MATISKTHVSLRFAGDDLDPRKLTALLGGMPSTCTRKGDVILSKTSGRERIAKTGSWTVSAERREPGDLDAQIAEIFRHLAKTCQFGEALGNIDRTYSWVYSCGESNEGIEISAHSLSSLGERGILPRTDIYGHVPELNNIQIIDRADNATFSVFQATDDEFNRMFPSIGQDMEIAETHPTRGRDPREPNSQRDLEPADFKARRQWDSWHALFQLRVPDASICQPPSVRST